MDTPDVTQSRSEESKLELNRDSLQALYETGGWASFLAILMFVLCGIMVLASFTIGSVLSQMENTPFPFPSALLTTIYLVMAVIYFIPALYLYRFATQARSAIQFRDSDKIAIAMQYLKKHYKFIGILCIVTFAIYILAIILILTMGVGQMMGDSVNA